MFREDIVMNKKEILEIRKQFTPRNCAITRICGCYVDHEKTKKMESKDMSDLRRMLLMSKRLGRLKSPISN